MSESSQITSPAVDTLPPNSGLRNYTIIKTLGRGGFGTTYLVHDENLDADYVLKEYMPRMLSSRDTTTMQISALDAQDPNDTFNRWKDRFWQEARTLAKLNHPNIIRVKDLFNELGTAYYVMEFIDGQELHLATESRRDEDTLQHLLRRLLSALQYLHGKGILHRDIKPSNILVKQGGEPVLIDFGAIRAMGSGLPGTQISSPGYSPMEQKGGEGPLGTWTDIYALGATFCHALTGQCPPDCIARLMGTTAFEPLAERAELKAAYSHSFLRALDKALEILPKNRWQTAEEWLAALDTPPAEEDSTAALQEYERQMAENNRPMEEYTRRVNETKAANPTVEKSEDGRVAEKPVAADKVPDNLPSVSAADTEIKKYDIFEAIDHNSWHELMLALAEEETPSRRRKDRRSPKTYAEKKKASKEICQLLGKKDDSIKTIVALYIRMQQGDYEAACQYIDKGTPGDIVFCGKQYDVETLLCEAGTAGCEKAAGMLIDGLRKEMYGISYNLDKAYTAAKQIATCKMPWAAELLRKVKILYFGRRYNVILSWYMLYLLLAIFLFDGMWLAAMIIPAVLCLVRQWDKIPVDETREHWCPYDWDFFLFLSYAASIGLLGIYGIILIVHACGSMTHADYTTEYVVYLSVCMTLAFRRLPYRGYSWDDNIPLIAYGSLSLLGLIGLCFLSPFATRLENGTSAMSNLCLGLMILNILPTAWGLFVSPNLTIRCYHGHVIAGCVLFFCLIGFVCFM